FRGLQLAERPLSFSHIADFAEVVTDICAGRIFTLAIVIDRYRPSRRIGRVVAAWLHQVGRIFDHGRKIALRRAAEIPVRLIFYVSGMERRPEAPWPLSARPRLCHQPRIIE